MGNKHAELEICVHLQDHDIAGITEIWWDGSHNWNVTVEGYRLFKGMLGR